MTDHGDWTRSVLGGPHFELEVSATAKHDYSRRKELAHVHVFHVSIQYSLSKKTKISFFSL